MSYQLSIVDESKRDMFYIKVVGDVNDGNYVTEEIVCEPDIFRRYWLQDVIDLYMNYSGEHELGDFHETELVPMGELDNLAHTLVRLEVTYIDIDGVLYDVNLKGNI